MAPIGRVAHGDVSQRPRRETALPERSSRQGCPQASKASDPPASSRDVVRRGRRPADRSKPGLWAIDPDVLAHGGGVHTRRHRKASPEEGLPLVLGSPRASAGGARRGHADVDPSSSATPCGGTTTTASPVTHRGHSMLFPRCLQPRQDRCGANLGRGH